MSSPIAPSSSVRLGDRLRGLPRWLLALLLASSFAVCWVVVYATGGTHNAFPHVFYVPIVLSAIPFGVRGGLVAGAAAMLLCGPAMPLDVTTGEPQDVANWLGRGGFFVSIAVLSGRTATSLRRSFEASLADHLLTEMERGSTSEPDTIDEAWAARIRQTLTDRSFAVVFQPIYALHDGSLASVEALTRFAGQPTAPPDVWFAQAHLAGLGIELELATLAAALEASHDLDPGVALSFNASPQLLTDPRLLALVDQHPHRSLIVEVTEHAVIDDYHEIARALDGLRSRGLRIAVDDAGAGFASLRHIVRLQPDVIKLDPSLTQNVGHDPVRRPLADALLQFSDRTGIRVTVEGMETHADLVTWQELGAHAAQGYLLARPGPLPFPAHYQLTPARPDASRRPRSDSGSGRPPSGGTGSSVDDGRPGPASSSPVGRAGS